MKKAKTKNAWINKRFTQEQLDEIKNSAEILSIKEACDFLKVNRATLYRWTEKDIIDKHSMGGRKYYFKTEIIDSIKRHSSKPAIK